MPFVSLALAIACRSAPDAGVVGSPPPPDPSDRRPLLATPLTCAPGRPPADCARDERARAGVERAIPWLAARYDDPTLPTNLDTLIALVPVAEQVQDPRLDALLTKLRPTLDRTGDPRRRAYDPDARLAENPNAWWEAVPGSAVHPSQVFVEVLYCAEHGLRRSTIDWLCTTYRDDGGPSSVHTAWFLALADAAGCAPRATTCLDPVLAEIIDASRYEPAPTDTTGIDRLGEQVLFGTIAGAEPGALAPAVDRLLGVQRADGAFAAPGAADTPDAARREVHATLVGIWGLTVWLGPRLAPPR